MTASRYQEMLLTRCLLGAARQVSNDQNALKNLPSPLSTASELVGNFASRTSQPRTWSSSLVRTP
uniref:Uncharacterized protein n=1 Tax=Aegilops tauschii subsp. strangulata TaxID=200361 RepID=A0A453S6C7_AEGTS